MSHMSETEDFKTFDLDGLTVRFLRPTQGQIEAMIRIARSTKQAEDAKDAEFWVRQVGRVGDLLEQMIHPDDREAVEDLYIAGKLDHTTLLTAILKTVQDEAEESENKAIAKAKKVSGARVQRK